MSIETITRTITGDTGETITVPELPADDQGRRRLRLDGQSGRNPMGGSAELGGEGWDAGAWPLIILAVTRTRDGAGGELFGYGTYVEGDTATHWFRSQNACFEAITNEVFFHWNMGQSDGPTNLPATAAQLDHQDRRPYAPITA